MSTETITDKRTALLDSAIRVIADQGLRGLTHRAVEAEAGLPHGSTTYYFGTREDLVVAIGDHIASNALKDMVPIAQQLTLALADRSKPVDIEELTRGLLIWIDQNEEVERVRYELELFGARIPELRQRMFETCQLFAKLCEPIAVACGSKDPERDGTLIQQALDGWMFHRIVDPHPRDEIPIRGMKLLLESIGNE